MNVHKILRKEYQVVDRWAVDEVSVSEMFFQKYLENAS